MPDTQPKRVFLIDSMSHIFRAFFAPMGARQEPLRNSKGQITQAVFVFTNMLRKLLNDEKPDYIAAVFDSAEKTFRHESFEDYKANREEMPDDLASQLPYIMRVCEAFEIPILKMPGFEADDIIGTLAKECKKKKLQAVIVSNDKDLCQLVSDPYIVCMRQNSQNIKRKVPVPPIEWCDEDWVLNKFGVPPEKITQLLGLMGDASDNIPGAPGIGEKGALKIILEYGSIENAIANADKITHKTYRESLQNNQDIILQSLDLATIHDEVPVELDLDALRYTGPDRKLAYELFKELEFSNLMKEFADGASGSATPSATDSGPSETACEVIKTRDELDKLIRKIWEVELWSFEVDDSNSPIDASSFDREAPLGIAIASAPGVTHYIDLASFEGDRDAAIKALSDTFSNAFLAKCCHDLKRNLASLRKLGITPKSVKDDTMIAAYLIDSGRKNDIESIARNFIDREMATQVPDGVAQNSFAAAERADLALRLAPVLRERIETDGLGYVYDEMEMPLIPVLLDIEIAGLKVDVGALAEFSSELEKELAKLSKKIFKIAGREFNIGSPKQVGEILAELNIETGKKTATGQVSTSKDILAELAQTYEIAQLIIDYREVDKLKSTYADALPSQIASDGRIHGKLNQTVTATGRLSSTDPNLQNIPVRTELGQRIRAAFIPEKGNEIVSADYSQLELRILAHITRDKVMLDAYKKNEDIHSKTAELVFGAKTPEEMKEKRRLAKIVNFGIAYAVEAFGLSQRVGISRAEARDVIDDYYKTYKGIKKFMEDTPEVAREQGFVTSLCGRRRYFPSITDRNYAVRSRAERESINMPIQGSASDIVKIAMLRVDKALRREGLKTRMIMQVHDELLFECPKDEKKRAMEVIKEEMEKAYALDVPLIAEIGAGPNWMDAK